MLAKRRSPDLIIALKEKHSYMDAEMSSVSESTLIALTGQEEVLLFLCRVSLLRDMPSKLVETWHRVQLLAQDPDTEVPESILDLVIGMPCGRYRKYLI